MTRMPRQSLGYACIVLVASLGRIVQSYHQSYQYQDFLSRVQPLQTKRLFNFAETVWHVHHGLAPPQKACLAPGQECDAPVSSLQPIQPFHDAKEFGWSKGLTQSYQIKIIKEELNAYLDTIQHETNDWKTSTTNLCDDTRGFTKLTLRNTDGDPTQVGLHYFHKTLQLLQSTVSGALAPRPVCINCQHPRTGLAPHSDNMNFLLTCHVGLVVPDGCIFTNHDQEYKWQQGELAIADTSFVHSTRNDSSEKRYVLSFCVWHPDLTLEERQGILRIHDALQEEVEST